MNSISVVVPVYNEAKSLHSFLVYLQKMNSNNIMEFLVVDGGSTDGDGLIDEHHLIIRSTRIRPPDFTLKKPT